MKKYIILSASFILILILTMFLNHKSLTSAEIIMTFLGKGSIRSHFILFDLRIPRMLIVLLVGAALSVAGCVFQAVTHNELAEPGLLGVNSGSILMIVIYLLYANFPSNDVVSIIMMPVLSFIGGITVAVVLLLLMRSGQFSNHRLIMNGLAINALFSSALIIMTLKLKESDLNFLVSFNAGTIYGTNWSYVWMSMPLILLFIVLIYLKQRHLNVLFLYDDVGKGLGISTKEQYRLMIYATVLSAVSVSVAGGISIVGLIAPHISRLLVGADHKRLIPWAAATGSLIVAAADLLSQYILNQKIPTGIIIIIICTPYLISKIALKRRAS